MNVRVALLAAIAVASGCDKVFGVHGTADAGLGDATDDAIVPIDGAPGAPCSPMTLLGDTFDANSLTTNWPTSYVQSGALDSITVSESQAFLHVTSDNGYAIMTTPLWYDMHDQLFSLKFVDSGNIALDPAAIFQVTLNSATKSANGYNYKIVMTRVDDQLYAEAFSDDGLPQRIGTTTYDKEADAYVRFGVRDGNAVFETSMNESDWMGWGTIAYGHMDLVQPYIAVRHGVGDWEIGIDEIMGGTPVGTVCDIDSLQDTFDTGPLAETWYASQFSSLSAYDFDNKDLHIHTMDATGTSADNYLTAARPYDLRDGELFFEIAQQWMSDPAKVVQLVIEGFGHNIIVQEAANHLSITYFQDGASTKIYDGSYDPANRWIKVGRSGSNTTFSISPDGKTWSQLASNPTIHPLGAAQVYLHVVSASTPDDIRIDNVNIQQP